MFFSISTGSLNELFNEFSAQMLLSTAQNIVLFILLVAFLFLIVSTPVFLSYFSVENFIKIKQYRKIIDHNICCKNRKTHKSYEHKICLKYVDSNARFTGNLSGLITWNILSLIYISTQYADFSNGIISYFIFPFNVLNDFTYGAAIESIGNYSSSWLFMGSILVATIVVSLVVKKVTHQRIQRKIKTEIERLSLSLA